MFILVQSKMKNIYIFEPEKFQISTK